MKILFLDIDGVCNSEKTFTQQGKCHFPIDPYMAFLVGKIQLETDCKVVLSSSWRHHPESVDEVEKRIVPLIGLTPTDRKHGECRGHEIQRWLDNNLVKCDHPTSCPKFSRAMCMGHKVTKYAILDDDSDMLEEQLPNFFKTTWKEGLTDEIAEAVIKHLNS